MCNPLQDNPSRRRCSCTSQPLPKYAMNQKTRPPPCPRDAEWPPGRASAAKLDHILGVPPSRHLLRTDQHSLLQDESLDVDDLTTPCAQKPKNTGRQTQAPALKAWNASNAGGPHPHVDALKRTTRKPPTSKATCCTMTLYRGVKKTRHLVLEITRGVLNSFEKYGNISELSVLYIVGCRYRSWSEI